ncbi:bifunctional pyr operon transcriptional regulator/uracil phosphoribosyltransferase PyrR [Rubrobacter indicoceani]|uniref:bifunctional pyr operon transcriptional regulator/uracil phosphoribosyltransferase PyrR n=1 Tax=Rubrobacter indicoceani TaxID=2051957 RepID=UPI000E5A4C18|nr:bifunctional pyr operon transcriptional regulator/uracil phosphoribosyltransferase PyrR [Rubrobacter indicoceani]
MDNAELGRVGTEERVRSVLLSEEDISRSLRRISHEILERNSNALDYIVLVGVLTRGVPLARRIAHNLRSFEGIEAPVGSLDITLHRDDLDGAEEPEIGESYIPFDVTGKTVVLVDDVFYTGRTARAAMDALSELGRPAAVRLAILVDRGHRELPIRADHVGKNAPTAIDERVVVSLSETDAEDEVVIVGR